jgi:cytochrome b involved in lipid metabolism
MSKSFSVADVATHKDAESGMYIIIDENVYDVAGLSPSSPPLQFFFRSIMGANPLV